MSDLVKPQAKDLAQLRAELQIPDEKESLEIKRDEAKLKDQKERSTAPKMMKHYNDKGSPLLKHKDYSHQQQPGGAMKGK